MTVWAPLQTIVDTIYRRVCPLYSFDKARGISLLGSGVPFQSGGLAFLITAAHVCEPAPNASIPLFTVGTEKPRPLTGKKVLWGYKLGRTSDPDIAIIQLSTDDVADLQDYYQFSTPAGTATTKPKTPGVHYLIAGYPAARNPIPHPPLPDQFLLPSRAISLVTGDIRPISDVGWRNKIDYYHFALRVPRREIRTPQGDHFQLPKPYGMSGGGVWRIDIDIRNQLVTTPLLVGIGIEYHKSRELFVVTRVQAAIPLAYELLPH